MNRRVTILSASGESRSFEVPDNTLLLTALRDNNAAVHAVCNGKGTCKKCHVEIKGRGLKLSCQTVIDGDLEVVLPKERAAAILHTAAKDLLSPPYNPGLMKIQGAGASRLMYRDAFLCELPKEGDLYGIAVDIGTTTVVVYLHNLTQRIAVDVASFLNPQAEYGQDVISRIHYTMENPAGLQILRSKIHAGINRTIQQFCAEHGIGHEDILKAVVVGNTTMLHLFAGVNPQTLALAPFVPVFTDMKKLRGAESGLHIHPQGLAFLLPSLSAYIGSDITAGMAAVALHESDRPSLLIDIGTNGEMALGNKEAVHCCSTAAGPAFEGARIHCGTGGVEGAISRFRDGTYETIGGKPPIGICGSGLVDIVAHLLEKGLVTPEGFMENDFLLEKTDACPSGKGLIITPRDIREVQLGKAAIAAGVRILMKEAGVDFRRIDTVYLAGGFGNHIDPESAVKIGMLPKELLPKIKPVGNTAGYGAEAFLKSVFFEEALSKVIELSRYIELSSRQDFNDEFVEGMAFPG